MSSNQQNNYHIDAKLPKIEISKFHGKPIEWQRIWDQFSAGDDSTTNIPDVLRCSYLKGVLSKDNNSIALKILRESYANKQVLISSYMESFVKLQPRTSMKNVSTI